MFAKMIFSALMTQSVFIAVVRHCLTAFGAVLVTNYGWSNDTWTTVTGVAMTLAGLGWSAMNKQLNPGAAAAPVPPSGG
ncbi:MAG: hypothetical protein GC186_16540 [Rhodobacteraceae bacterium]|nr:hypothetical protein [Paracoccaceae bacterium]